MKAAFDPRIREEARRPERQKSEKQIRTRAADQRRHRQFQKDQQSFRAGDVLVRLDRNFPEAGRSSLDAGKIRRSDEVKPPWRLRRRCFTPGLAITSGVPFANGAPNLTVDFPAMLQLAQEHEVAICGKDFKTGQTLMKTDPRAWFQGAHARPQRLVFHQHSRQSRRRSARRSRLVQDEGRIEARRTRIHPPARALSRRSTARCTTRSASTITRRAATTKKAGTTSTSSVGSATRCRSRSISSAAIRFLRRRSSRSRAIPRSRAARRHARDPGVAQLLFQVADDRAEALSRARSIHSADEAEEHASLDDGRGPDHPPRPGVLRLSAIADGSAHGR